MNTMGRAKRIFCVVAYDISDDKIRDKVAEILEKYGVRINFSVFECLFTLAQFKNVQVKIKEKLLDRLDSVVYYPICVDCFSKIVYQPEKEREINTVSIF